MNSRIRYIDELKGFAILLVVMNHVYHFVLCDKQNVVNEVICSFYMPLFFLLSGFVIHTPPNFLKCVSKIGKYVVPFLVIGSTFTITCGSTIKDFLLDQTNYGYWYLIILWYFYLLLMFNYFNKDRRNWPGVFYDVVFFIVVYELIAHVVIPILGNTKLWNTGQLLIKYWPFFYMGYFMRKYGVMNYISKHNAIFSFCLIAYVLSMCFMRNMNYSSAFLAHHSGQLIAFFAVIAICFLFANQEQECFWYNKYLAKTGRYTLEIYVFHFFVLRHINLSGIGTYLSETYNNVIEFILCVALSLTIILISVGIGKIVHQSTLLSTFMLGKSQK